MRVKSDKKLLTCARKALLGTTCKHGGIVRPAARWTSKVLSSHTDNLGQFNALFTAEFLACTTFSVRFKYLNSTNLIPPSALSMNDLKYWRQCHGQLSQEAAIF
jgi:hypothetical protein